MLAEPVVSEIRRLLAEPGLSQRKIALLTGVSRASVSSIASGRRPDYLPPRVDIDDGEDQIGNGPVDRCPTCGGKVYMPCRLCRIRALKAEERKKVLLRLAAADPSAGRSARSFAG